MKCHLWTALFFALVGVSRAADTHILPSDPSMPVVEMWYVDQGRLRAPEISIFAGGRVQVRIGDGTLWGEMSPQQVSQLVNALLTSDRLSSITTAEIDQAIAAESIRTGLSSEIRGAADTIIRVRTSSGTYRVDGHAVGLLSTRFPAVQPLQSLYSAQQRLENVRAVVMVGGAPSAERLARLAQAQLQSEMGEQVTVGQENLSCVHSLTDGTRCCQFLVPAPPGSGAAPRIISLFESPGEAPRVSVLPEGPSLR